MKKILLVDDDRVNLTMLKMGLKSYYQVDAAHDGEEGIELLKAQTPDIIILDVQMPKMGGFEFLNEMKSLGIEVPVVMLTANENLEDVFKMEGVQGYLVKPIHVEALRDKVEEVFG